MAAFLAVLTWKMAIYVAVLLGLCWGWSRTAKDRNEWKATAANESRAAIQAQAQVLSLQESIKAFRAEGEAQRLTLAAALNDAAFLRARFETLNATVQALPVPTDAAGAFDLLADVANFLKETGHDRQD